jgi:hypothetical protein
MVPVVFVYIILIKYQGQIIVIGDENTMIKVYDISQKYISLFFLWYQYLSCRFIFNTGQKEVIRFDSFRRESWLLVNLVLTYLLLGGYFFWLFKISENDSNVYMILLQLLFLTVQAALMINITGSALIGFVGELTYVFVSIIKYIPDGWSIIRVGIMPIHYGKMWIFNQLILTFLLFCIYKITEGFEKKS